MNQLTTKSLIRAFLVGAIYAALAVAALHFVGKAAGLSGGLEHTTAEGIIAYWLSILFLVLGAKLVVFRWMFRPELDHGIPQLLIGALLISMVCGIVYLGPPIPLPD